MSQVVQVSVSGGYNGGAVISIKLDGNEVFHAVGNSPYNLDYDVKTGTFVSAVGTVNITITPPPNSTSDLYISFTGPIYNAYSVHYLGNNTSYGYSFNTSFTIGGSTGNGLYGKTVSVYTVTGFYSRNEWASNFPVYFNNKTLYKSKYNMILPIVTDFSYYDSIIDHNFISNDGIVDSDTAEALDGFSTNWQLSAFYWYTYNESKYDTAKSLWPYAISLEPNTGYIFWDGETDEVIVVQTADNYTSGASSTSCIEMQAVFSISTGTTTSSISGLSEFDTYQYRGTWGGGTLFWYYPLNDNIIQLNHTTRDIYSASGGPTVFANQVNPDFHAVSEFWTGAVIDYRPVSDDTDPYSQGGNSGTGGGEGTFSDTGDLIGVPSLPTLSAVDTGFITLFNPTLSQLKALANYMWSSSFDMSLWKNIVANPIDCILGLSIVPVDPPDAGARSLVVGNISTNVTMNYISTQYVEVDCGTLNIAEFWGSYLDYSPYTKIQLYLPYLGIVPVDIDDMQNSTIHVVYHIDVLSGACVAYVLCGGTQLYTYVGQCSSNIPITSNDFTNVVTGALTIGASIASIVVSEGATAPQAVGTMANASVNMLKPNIKKSGAMSGTGGMLGVQTPYLICQRPRQSVPARQNHFTGYPSNITYTLSDLSGYTVVQDVHLDNVPCTDAEMNEILEYLTGGVVI